MVLWARLAQALAPSLASHQQPCGAQALTITLARSLASLHAAVAGAAGGHNAACVATHSSVCSGGATQRQQLPPQQQQQWAHLHHHQQQQHHQQRGWLQQQPGTRHAVTPQQWPQRWSRPHTISSARACSNRAAEAELVEADRRYSTPGEQQQAQQQQQQQWQTSRAQQPAAGSSSAVGGGGGGDWPPCPRQASLTPEQQQQQQHRQDVGIGSSDGYAVTEHQEESVVVPVAVRDLVSASPSDTRSEVHLSGSSGLLQHQQWRQQAASAATSSAAQPQKIPVNAVHLAGEIDFQSFATDVNPKHSAIARDHALLEFEDMADDRVLLGAGGSEAVERRIMVVYRFGGVVFFNTRARARERLLEKVLPYVKLPRGGPAAADAAAAGIAPEAGAGPTGGLRTDETTVVVRSNLGSWSALEPDKVVVQTLDVANVRVISHVLGQSVALDYYNEKVDAAIQQFNPYLVEVARSGACDNVKEARLLQLIADNSLLYTDVVTKIGLLDISQTAWTQDRYHELWQSLRVDYEIDRRFDAINRKLGPMIENAKFLLDIRAESKSSNAELTIIVLICLEVVVNMVGHVMHWGS